MSIAATRAANRLRPGDPRAADPPSPRGPLERADHHDSANEEHPLEVYRFLRDDLGAEFIQFIPIVERPSPGGIPTGDQVTDRSVSPSGYGAFLSTVFDEWVRRDVGTVFVQMFDTTLANYLNVPGGMCVHARTCGNAVALEHTGDLYSCDHFVEPNHLLGNITETPMLELIASPSRSPSDRPSTTTSPASAEVARSDSPATAAAPRTGSPPPPTANPACTTCAPASRHSSPTSIAPCGSWPPPCAPAASPKRSPPGWHAWTPDHQHRAELLPGSPVPTRTSSVPPQELSPTAPKGALGAGLPIGDSVPVN